ncbi:hypothetical protein N7492_004283 [Penicillium capsulatum]|uniref:FAD-binding PCMH-type domain-containing protein n=1 Tax=Penicillium capsulatum TaxID=69766 RepID=A0A9W9I7J2_9EURO|nr:hypothetical protein N7492_004283 [Penicillium capsulatum]KAJ6136597.1 hypothetical protein N7512_001757 [Penicillium capsulatum]
MSDTQTSYQMLESIVPVSFPASPSYEDSVKSYFAQQNSQVRPSCVLSPVSVEEVAAALPALVSILDQKDRTLAIRAGGHSYLAGSSNTANGVTIDLRNLNAIQVSQDRSTVWVGAGATWGELYALYAQLDALHLSVVGTRVSDVGVGGFITGGGISYFSPRYGWACDTAFSFEIVLEDGSVIHASDHHRVDLARALRGGSNNFGIVTRVKFQAFEQGPLWGGVM